MAKIYKRPIKEYLEKRIRKEVQSDCWIWLLAKDKNGYGVAHKGRKNFRAHRVSYEAFIGYVPPHLYVLHRCDNPPCVNPDHLFLGTNQDNMDDMVLKGRKPRKTHCPQGPPYVSGNICYETDGSRKCKKCKSIREKKSYLKRKLTK